MLSKKKSAVTLGISFLMIAAIVLTACAAPTPTAAPVEKPAETKVEENAPRQLKIALVHESANYQHSEQIRAGAAEMAKALGADIITTDADWDRNKMIADLDSVIEQKPDAIIIDHGGDGLKPGIEKALGKGIPVIAFDNPITDVPGLVMVSQDDYEMAFLSLKQLIQDINGSGEIAVAWVGGFAPMEKRQRVLDIMLKLYPQVKVVATYGEASANTVNDTLTKTEAALQANPNIKAIWATWDQFALGANQALIQQKRTDVGLYSIDISAEDAAQMRAEGSPWKATATADAREVGRILMRLAVNAAYKQTNPTFVVAPVYLVTQDQIRALKEGEIPTSGPSPLGWSDFLWKLYEGRDAAAAKKAMAAIGIGTATVERAISLPAPATLPAGFSVKPLKIAIVHESANYQHSEQIRAGASEMAKALGAEIITTDADWDRNKMIADLDSVIEQNPDAIIIDHGGDGLKPGIVKALGKGIPVVAFDNPISDVPGLVIVSQDDYDMAFKSLKALVQDINGEGEIAVAWVGGFAPMEKRQRVLDIMLKLYPAVKVVATYGEASANTVNDTLTKTEAAIQANPKIKAVWATWDQFALGVNQALIQQKRTDIGLYSIDISAEDVALMRAEGSPWKATAAADAREVGRVMMRLAVNAAYDQPVPTYVVAPVFLVTQSQVRALPEGTVPTAGASDLGWTPFLVALKNLVK